MDVALLFARVALAVVLAAAGAGKLRARAAAREAVAGFGVGPALAPAVAILVPVAELAIAILLIPVATAAWAAVAALVLLAGFTGAMLLNLSRGRTPPCNCFGAASRRPIGARSIVRNAVLMAVAAFIAIAGWHDAGSGLLEWFSTLSTPVIAGIVLAAAFALSVGLFAWLGRSSRVAGDAVEDDDDPERALAVGDTAPAFVAEDLDGNVVGLAALRRPGLPTLLVFTDPGCASCVAMMPDLARWQRDLAGDLTVVVVSSGAVDEVRAETDTYGMADVLVERGRGVSDAYRIIGTPSAIVVGADGRIAVEEAEGADQIELLINRQRWRAPAERES